MKYCCMWPNRPQYMDLGVIEKNLCGPLRFVFEYPCSTRLSNFIVDGKMYVKVILS